MIITAIAHTPAMAITALISAGQSARRAAYTKLGATLTTMSDWGAEKKARKARGFNAYGCLCGSGIGGECLLASVDYFRW